MTKAQIDP
jgi:hypothetical protein